MLSGYRFNVTNEKEVESAVKRIESEVGAIDILVNNAGIIRRVPLLDMPLDEWELVVKTDLTSAFHRVQSRCAADDRAGRRQGHQHLLDDE